MGFIILLILTTLSIAGSAAFFSVLGLARVFSGAYWSVVFMGSSLEAGKLVGASYLYRYWSKISKPMRAYLLVAVFILMMITSMGIFGYLSSAFQDNILPFQQRQQQIELLEADKTEADTLKAERLARSDQINKQIADLPNDYVTGRKRLMEANKDELDQIRKDITAYTEQIRTDTLKISELKSQVLQETAHVGPIIFIANVFGADVNQATKWLILLIIGAFDPLAVVLTVGANMAILEYKTNRKAKEPVIVERERIVEVPVERIVERIVQAPVEHIEPPIEEEIVIEEESITEPAVIAKNMSAFERAHELFNNPDLTPQEKIVKDTLETSIRNYTSMLHPTTPIKK